MSRLVGVDLGKTGCRALVLDGDTLGDPMTGPGAPGLAEPNGAEAAFDAVWSALSQAIGTGSAARLVVGAAGAEAAPTAAALLARRLSSRLPGCTVAVTSDSVTAHAGALGGAPGSVLAVGTGSVAVGISADGRLAQVDGWGPWLGDDGSGAWIGREGLRAVLRAVEGRDRPTDLREAAEKRFGELAALPRTLAAGGAVARTTATFAPDVLAAARAGDAAASDIVRRAGGAWVGLVAAAAATAEEARVAVVGGLAASPVLVEEFRAQLPGHLELTTATGTALDGALLLAGDHALPHGRRLRWLAPGPTRDRPDGNAVADVDGLATEQVRTDLSDLDERTPAELVEALLEAESSVPDALLAARASLTAAARLAGASLSQGGRLIYAGAGTPGRLAALDAAECPPTFGTSPDQVVAMLAGGRTAAERAVEGAEDDAAAGRADLLAVDPGPRDLVVGITASGRTPYVLAALEVARERGCPTVAVVNNPGSSAAARADVAVELLTGAEVLSGSTRLKAGTAQKVALNVISTSAMVAAGKTYGAWMVDMVATNEKLRRRARRILREAAGVTDQVAVAALEDASWRTKPALVALLACVSATEAQVLLDLAGGRVREALALRTEERSGEVKR